MKLVHRPKRLVDYHGRLADNATADELAQYHALRRKLERSHWFWRQHGRMYGRGGVCMHPEKAKLDPATAEDRAKFEFLQFKLADGGRRRRGVFGVWRDEPDGGAVFIGSSGDVCAVVTWQGPPVWNRGRHLSRFTARGVDGHDYKGVHEMGRDTVRIRRAGLSDRRIRGRVTEQEKKRYALRAANYKLGMQLRAVLHSARGMRLLNRLGHPGWTEGGCRVLAEALKRWGPKGTIVQMGQGQHAVYRRHGLYFDGDGVTDRARIELRWGWAVEDLDPDWGLVDRNDEEVVMSLVDLFEEKLPKIWRHT